MKFILDHYGEIAGALLAIYELIALAKPTLKSYSITKKILFVLHWLVDKADRKKNELKNESGGNNAASKPLNKVNLILLFLLFSSSLSFGQQWQAFKGIWLNGYANATLAPTPPAGYSGITYFADSLGTYVYDPAAVSWLRIPGAGGGTLTGAQNGVGLNGTVVELGFPLIRNTNIAGGTFSFTASSSNLIRLSASTASQANLNLVPTLGSLYFGSVGNQQRIDVDASNLSLLTSSDPRIIISNSGNITATGEAFTITPISDNQNPIFLVEEDGGTDILRIFETGGESKILIQSTSSSSGAGDDIIIQNNASDINAGIQIIAGGTLGLNSFGTINLDAIGAIDIGAMASVVNMPWLSSIPLPSPGIAGQSLRRNAGNTAWENFTPASGITNTAANNEMAKSDGTNLIPSGIFSTTSGDILQGDPAGAGAVRNTTAQGSAADISLTYNTKGTGSILLNTSASDLALSATQANLTTTGEINLTATNSVFHVNGGGAVVNTLENDGDFIIGGLAQSGSRSISVLSSDASADLSINTQGAGGEIFLNVQGTAGVAVTNTSGSNGSVMMSFVDGISMANVARISAAEIEFAGLVDQFTFSGVGATVGGDLNLNGGDGASGAGGNIVLTAGTGTTTNGFIILNNLPTTCTGAPTNALAIVAGVLTPCP